MRDGGGRGGRLRGLCAGGLVLASYVGARRMGRSVVLLLGAGFHTGFLGLWNA